MDKIFFKPGQHSTKEIEAFMDGLCDNLFINDTYYGNLNIALITISDLLAACGQNSNIGLEYGTDHKLLFIHIDNIDSEIYKRLKTDKLEDDRQNEMEVLKHVCNSIDFHNDDLILSFDIAAVHDSIFKYRLKLMQEYFNKVKVNS